MDPPTLFRRRSHTRPKPWSGALWAGQRIGILGGSFNPAHSGHRHISEYALKVLGLDQVWWLVSPQNPLKSTDDMAPFAVRYGHAKHVARHPAIVVTDIETRLGTRYTADTLGALTRRYPKTRFVWLMGADNLAQIPKWDRWTRIFNTVPIAVFDRDSYSLRVLGGVAAQRYARHRVAKRQVRRLADRPAPAWAFVHAPRHPASATRLRAEARARGISATELSIVARWRRERKPRPAIPLGGRTSVSVAIAPL